MAANPIIPLITDVISTGAHLLKTSGASKILINLKKLDAKAVSIASMVILLGPIAIFKILKLVLSLVSSHG